MREKNAASIDIEAAFLFSLGQPDRLAPVSWQPGGRGDRPTMLRDDPKAR